MSDITSESPPSSALVAHISAQAGSCLPPGLRTVLLELSAELSVRAARRTCIVHLARRPNAPSCGTRRAERACVEAVPQPMHGLVVSTTLLRSCISSHRAHRHARRRACMQGPRSTSHPAPRVHVTPSAVHAPRDSCSCLHADAAVALDATLASEKFHSCQVAPQSAYFVILDACTAWLGFLHHGHDVVTLGGACYPLAPHYRLRSSVVVEQSLPSNPPSKWNGHNTVPDATRSVPGSDLIAPARRLTRRLVVSRRVVGVFG